MKINEIYFEEQNPLCDLEEDRQLFDFKRIDPVRLVVWAKEKNPLYDSQPYDAGEEHEWSIFISELLLYLAGSSTEFFNIPIVRKNDITRLHVPMSRERIMYTMNEAKRFPQALFLMPRERGYIELPQEIQAAVMAPRIALDAVLKFCRYAVIVSTDKRMVEIYTLESHIQDARTIIERLSADKGMAFLEKLPKKIFLERNVPIEPEKYYHFRLAGFDGALSRHKVWVDLLSEKKDGYDEIANHLIEARWVSFAKNLIYNLSNNAMGLFCLSFPPPSRWSEGNDGPDGWDSENSAPVIKAPPQGVLNLKRQLLTTNVKGKPAPHAPCPCDMELKSKLEEYCHGHYEDYYFVLQIPCTVDTAHRIKELVHYGRLNLQEAIGRCECIVAHGIEEPLLEIFSEKISAEELESAAGAAARSAGGELVAIKPA